MKTALWPTQAVETSKVLDQPLRLAPGDHSGTPVALIELARRAGKLERLDDVDPDDVLIEFPMGQIPAKQTGASRVVRLRTGGYALIS